MQLIFFYDLSFALTSAVKKRYLVHFGKQDCIEYRDKIILQEIIDY